MSEYMIRNVSVYSFTKYLVNAYLGLPYSPLDSFHPTVSLLSGRICCWVSDIKGAFLVAQLVKNPPAMQKTPVQFLGWEDPLEKG